MPAILYLVGLAILYAIGYTLNMRTPKPEGCELIDAACNSCSVGACAFHPSQTQTSVHVTSKEEV